MDHIENPLDHRRATIICTIASVHFLLSVVLFFLWGAVTMSRFDGGGPSDFTVLLVNGAFRLLSFPLLTALLLLEIPNTGMWGWLGFLGNSMLWGWACWKVVGWRRQNRFEARPG